MKKGCIISLGCLSALIITAIIAGAFGVKLFLHLMENSKQFMTDCQKLIPIIAECNPEELNKYSTNQDVKFTELCNLIKNENDKVEEIGELKHIDYHENHGVSTKDGKSLTKVGTYSVSIKYTSKEKNLTVQFVDKGDGPKINSLNVMLN